MGFIRFTGFIAFRVSKNHGYLFGGPHSKDYIILGVFFGVPIQCTLGPKP